MYPKLVENKIKNAMNYNLFFCHSLKEKYFNIVFNFCSFCLVTGIVSLILYYKYKGSPNKKELIIRENKKRDYLLYNLRKFQNIKNESMTNITSE